jgi:hypothetical protein
MVKDAKNKNCYYDGYDGKILVSRNQLVKSKEKCENDCEYDLINPYCNWKEGYLHYTVKINKKPINKSCYYNGIIIKDGQDIKSVQKCVPEIVTSTPIPLCEDCSFTFTNTKCGSDYIMKGTVKLNPISANRTDCKYNGLSYLNGDLLEIGLCLPDKIVFTDPSSIWISPVTGTIAVFVVGGGGGGGYGCGGGGAGGEVVYIDSYNITAGYGYNVIVGKGGLGATNRDISGVPTTDNAGGQGGSSSFNDITAIGGGGGYSYFSKDVLDIANGASGGGNAGGNNCIKHSPGNSTNKKGNSGGYGINNNSSSHTNNSAGGGGGNKSAGLNGIIESNGRLIGGNGGKGFLCSIDNKYYGGGGGGAGHDQFGKGNHGGGNGGNKSSSPTSGSPNTGGGGGGGGLLSDIKDSRNSGANGGSGVVIIKFITYYDSFKNKKITNCHGKWSDCSVGCGDGIQQFSITTKASNGGSNCLNKQGDTMPCNLKNCDSDCFGLWSSCDVYCGESTQTYSIITDAIGKGSKCPYNNGETRKCKAKDCINCSGTWGNWSCCQYPDKKRRRKFTITQEPDGGKKCDYATGDYQYEDCNPWETNFRCIGNYDL